MLRRARWLGDCLAAARRAVSGTRWTLFQTCASSGQDRSVTSGGSMAMRLSDLLWPFPYLWSAQRVFNLHVLRSCASSLCTPFSFMSFLITSFHSISVFVFLSFSVYSLPCSHHYIFLSFSPHGLTISVSLLLFTFIC